MKGELNFNHGIIRSQRELVNSKKKVNAKKVDASTPS